MVNVHRTLEGDKSRIEAAISTAETGTSGEIVVLSARRADSYELESGLVAFAAACVGFAVVWLLLQTSRSTQPGPAFAGMTLGLAGGYAAGWVLCRLVPSLPMALAKQERRAKAVEDRAAIAFHDLHVSSTRAHTGILILIAEAERRVAVIGDSNISDNLTRGDWDGVRDAILAGIRQGTPVAGVEKGVQIAGELLSRHFPAQSDDLQEISNQVYFLN